MERFIKGDVVIVPFPFSDLSNSKRRPAFAVADLSGIDIILCQITSQNTVDNFSIAISQKDFISGNLPVDSNIRTSKIFTADKNIVIRKAGVLKKETTEKVIQNFIELLKK